MNYYTEMGIDDLPNEQWKDVPQFEGWYQCSNLGRIKSVGRKVGHGTGVGEREIKPRIRKQFINSNGYLNLNLNKHSTFSQIRTHRLVAILFVKGETTERTFVNHITPTKTDNRAENLEWVTRLENSKHASLHGLLKGSVYFGKENIRSKIVYQFDLNKVFIAKFYGTKEAERLTGISHKLIGRVCLGKRTHTKGYIWQYA